MPELQRLTRVTAQELVGVRVGGPVDLGDSLDVHLRGERACSRRASGYGGTFDSQPCVLGVARPAMAAGPDRCMRARCASAAQQMMTMRPKSVSPSPAIVKPVTVINRLSRVPAESVAARIITAGAECGRMCRRQRREQQRRSNSTCQPMECQQRRPCVILNRSDPQERLD